MAILVDLQVVPNRIFEVVKARILANRAKAQNRQNNQPTGKPKAKPRLHQSQGGEHYRRPEPAATGAIPLLQLWFAYGEPLETKSYYYDRGLGTIPITYFDPSGAYYMSPTGPGDDNLVQANPSGVVNSFATEYVSSSLSRVEAYSSKNRLVYSLDRGFSGITPTVQSRALTVQGNYPLAYETVLVIDGEWVQATIQYGDQYYGYHAHATQYYPPESCGISLILPAGNNSCFIVDAYGWHSYMWTSNLQWGASNQWRVADYKRIAPFTPPALSVPGFAGGKSFFQFRVKAFFCTANYAQEVPVPAPMQSCIDRLFTITRDQPLQQAAWTGTPFPITTIVRSNVSIETTDGQVIKGERVFDIHSPAIYRELNNVSAFTDPSTLKNKPSGFAIKPSMLSSTLPSELATGSASTSGSVITDWGDPGYCLQMLKALGFK